MASDFRGSKINTTHNHTPALPLVELQLAVLCHLPTPIFVLTPSGVAIFANNVAQKLLGTRPLSDIYGQYPGDLGLKLVEGSSWQAVLGKFEEEYNTFREKGMFKDEEAPVHAIHFTIPDHDETRLFAFLSGFNSSDGIHFVISIERPPDFKEVKRRELVSKRERDVPFYPEVIGSPKDEGPPPPYFEHDRIRNAVFENCDVPGIIVFADAEKNLFIPNNKSRVILGDMTAGNACCDSSKFHEKLQLWDKHFKRRLPPAEYPGIKLMQTRVPFSNYECGFTHAITGDKIVSAIDGECLYDKNTNEYLGGVIWLRDMKDLRDYSKLQEGQMPPLDILEKSGDLLPHLFWIHRVIDDELYYQFPDRWCDYTGLGKDSRPKFAIHPQDLPGIMRKWFAHHKLGTEYNHEVRFRRHDGVYRWMLLSVYPIRHGSKDSDMWAATNSDIHDSVMARSKDGRLKEQLLAVLSQTDVVLFIMSKDGTVTLAEGGVNDMGPDRNTPRVSELVGLNAFECARENETEGSAFEKYAREILAGKIEMAYTEDHVKDKTYRTKLVVDLDQNVVGPNGKPAIRGIMGLRTDVTDIMKIGKLEGENIRLAAEEQAAKASNELKSKFLANMSHELRTPTAGVIGMAELLSEDPTLTDDQREYISSIQLSGKALLTIVNDILDFSKIESGRLDIEEVPFQLSSIVAELCKLLSMFAQQKGLQFIHENCIDEKIELLGDPGRIRQILSNLLTNALKFTKEGWVKIRVTGTSRKEGDGEVLDVQFLIEDTGIGIEKEVLKKLFRPFSQGDSSTARLYGGTGLGLTICKNLASLMSGSISLESDMSSGSTAIFTVPLKVSPTSTAAFPAASKRKHSESRHYSDSSLTKVSSWTKPLPYKDRDMSQDLLNQAIGCSDTKSFSQPFIKEESPTCDPSQTPGTLTPEVRKNFHVLVVEDNAINQLIACRNIRKLGFPVTAVWNGKEALSYLLEPSPAQPRPDIILMDVQMPVMDGYEATNHLRTEPEYSVVNDPPVTPPVSPVEERKRVGWTGEGKGKGKDDGGGSEGSSEKGMEDVERDEERGKFKEGGKGPLSEIVVVAMTASCIQGDKEKCTNAGMDDYLAKPVNKERLEEMLVKWAWKMRC